jgi:uncharacterized protein
MSINLRPWIIGGVGVVGTVLLVDGMTHVISDWLPTIVVGSGVTWGYFKIQAARAKVAGQPISTRAITLDTVKSAVAEAETVVNQLAQEVSNGTVATDGQQLAKLRLQIHELLSQLDRSEIRIALMGGAGVGKSSLLELLKQTWSEAISQQLRLFDSAPLFTALDRNDSVITAWQIAKQADLVIFLTDGDLTESQMQVLQRLAQGYRRTLLVFNKQDQYLPREQVEILEKLRSRVQGVLPTEDVVGIATQPRPIKVRQYQEDGAVQEWLEEPETQITTLTDRLNTILLEEGQKLILASSLGNAAALKAEASGHLNYVRRDRAMPMLEKAQWIVAGTAFVNPFPAIDLLATAAINAQLVMDISALYQQKITFEQAKVVASTLAALMVKQGVVEVSSQAIAALLKSNAVTYAAGGLVQGVSGAYFTRLAGLTLIEYFESESNLQRVKKDKLQQILESVFQNNQRAAVLQLFVQQVVDRLRSELPSLNTTAPAPVETTPEVLPEAVGEAFTVNIEQRPAITIEIQPLEKELIK